MSFDAVVQPYFALNRRQQEELSAAQVKQRGAVMQQLVRKLREAVKQETGRDPIGEEQTGDCVAHLRLEMPRLVDHLKEHCAGYEDTELDRVYKGEQQTRFNNIIRLPDGGLFIPHYFFFPIWVQIKKLRNPIFVGSAPRLLEETGLLTESLGLDIKLVDSVPRFMDASREEMEDYETEMQGDLFFARMAYNFLRALADESVKSSFPVFINFDALS